MAIARPKPRPPPVTMALRSVRSKSGGGIVASGIGSCEIAAPSSQSGRDCAFNKSCYAVWLGSNVRRRSSGDAPRWIRESMAEPLGANQFATTEVRGSVVTNLFVLGAPRWIRESMAEPLGANQFAITQVRNIRL